MTMLCHVSRTTCRRGSGMMMMRCRIRYTPDVLLVPRLSRAKATVTSNAWSGSLELPETKFSLQANAAKRELLFRKRTTTDLYRWQIRQTDRPLFVLHDGPPYANGELHMGHALNKMNKDIICRYNVLMGKRVHYQPGWDCHGLPIEMKIYGKEEMKGKSPRTAPFDLIRSLAREEATKAIETQKEEFLDFGIMADWSKDTTYRTYDQEYVLRQMKVMRGMVKRGLIYRSRRPVYWSPTTLTAVAEAEIEYDDGHFSRTVYVRFPFTPGKKLLEQAKDATEAKQVLESGRVNALVWTTTAWTLPSNMALNVNKDLTYCLVRINDGPCKNETLIVAEDRIPNLNRLKVGMNDGKERQVVGSMDVLISFKGDALLDSTYRHPYLPSSEPNRPILAADYVTNQSGTGLVHSAPGHGHEDYLTWLDYCSSNPQAAKEEILSPVDDASLFTEDVRDENLVGLPVISAGAHHVIADLQAEGSLLSEIRLQHRYPMDWRTKKPLIVRSTPQWFANVESIRDKALKALESVAFKPPSSRARLEALVRKRDEWCISRQRVWGVPIPALYNVETGEPLLTEENMEHIEKVLEAKGIGYWWQGDAEEFVCPSIKESMKGVRWRTGEDVVDVWFDSGSSWTTLPDAEAKCASSEPVADVYLEGTDQHRGWFQSSLWTFIASGSESAPYKNVLTHGFLLDRKSQKMSKSVGNIMKPTFFIFAERGKRNVQAFGTDVVRFWSARGDPTKDVILSALVIKHSSEVLRKIRTTFRYLISTVPKRGQAPAMPQGPFGLLERYVMAELFSLDRECRKAYEAYDLARIVRLVTVFVNSTLSSVYFDVSKDVLYADPLNSPRRQTHLAVFDQILRTLVSVMAPITPHLAEEVHHYYTADEERDPTEEEANRSIEEGESPGSVFELKWDPAPDSFEDQVAIHDMERLLDFRSAVNALIEEVRQEKIISKSQSVDVLVSEEGEGHLQDAKQMLTLLRKHKDALPELFIVSDVNILPTLESDSETDASEWTRRGKWSTIPFVIRPAKKEKCPRCWTYRLEPTEEKKEKVCGRCQSALDYQKTLNGTAQSVL